MDSNRNSVPSDLFVVFYGEALNDRLLFVIVK